MEKSKLEIIERLEQIKYQAEELEAERIETSKILMEMMTEKEELIGEYIVKKITMTKYKPTMEQAEELGATKTKIEIDMPAIKKLAEKGVEIPKDESTYLRWENTAEKGE